MSQQPKTYAQIHQEAFGSKSEVERRRVELDRRVRSIDREEAIGNLLFYGLLAVLAWVVMRFV